MQGNSFASGSRKKVGSILTHQDGEVPLAIMEAKDQSHTVSNGMQLAIEYAPILDVKSAYSSNGEGFLEYDFFRGSER